MRITRPFYLGVNEVTRGQFRRFVADVGYQTEAEWDGKGGSGPDRGRDGLGAESRVHLARPLASIRPTSIQW